VKVQLTTQQQDELRRWLSENPEADDTDVLGVASYIACMQIEAIAEHVRKKLADTRQAAIWAERSSQAMFYPLLAPAPKPAIISEGRDEIVMQMPPRHLWKVRVRDLDAFCKANGLDKQKVIQLGEGQIPEHKGWQRSSGVGWSMALGQPYVAPRKPVDESAPHGGEKHVRYITAFSEPPRFWTVDGL
jgi:hypothetical protein